MSLYFKEEASLRIMVIVVLITGIVLGTVASMIIVSNFGQNKEDLECSLVAMLMYVATLG